MTANTKLTSSHDFKKLCRKHQQQVDLRNSADEDVVPLIGSPINSPNSPTMYPATNTDSSDTYTILISLPPKNDILDSQPMITMITDDKNDVKSDDMTLNKKRNLNHPRPSGLVQCPQCQLSYNSYKNTVSSHSNRHTGMSETPKLSVYTPRNKVQNHTRKKKQEQKQDKKAVKTLSAILLAFVVTWTPYNIFTVVGAFSGEGTINEKLYAIGNY